MCLTLNVKSFSFRLSRTLRTAQGAINRKKGWLLHLENKSGNWGWGEVSPLNPNELEACEAILQNLGNKPSREKLEVGTKTWPGPLAFGIGAALAELDGIVGSFEAGGWLEAPESAILLPQTKSLLSSVDLLAKNYKSKTHHLTLKLKVAIQSSIKEEELLFQILERLPTNARLRLDANAGWNRKEAKHWANHFIGESRLEWLEQPLPANDIKGLSELSKHIPIALDESLLVDPSLRQSWQGWQIRRPLLDGDPRILLQELHAGVPFGVLSTAFETGIGRRWLHHLAALQQHGPTPTAPGLAPGWCPDGPLFSKNPNLVWEAA